MAKQNLKIETLENRACTAFRQTFEEAHKSGGFEELDAAAKAAKEGLSQYIFNLAKDVQKTGRSVQVFLDICKEAERKMKDELNIGSLKEENRCWLQFKSNIKRAWSYHDGAIKEGSLGPIHFDTETAQRKALSEAKKAEKERSDGSPETGGQASQEGEEQAPMADSLPDELRKELDALVKLAAEARKMDGEAVNRLSDILRDAVEQGHGALHDLMGNNEPVEGHGLEEANG